MFGLLHNPKKMTYISDQMITMAHSCQRKFTFDMHHVKRMFDYFWQHQKLYDKQMQISFGTWPGGLSAGESGDPSMCKFWSFKVQIRSNFFIELEKNHQLTFFTLMKLFYGWISILLASAAKKEWSWSRKKLAEDMMGAQLKIRY